MTDIQKIINIIGYGNGVPVTDIAQVTFNDELTINTLNDDNVLATKTFVWASTPTRNQTTFAFINMDDIDTGIVYNLTLNIRYLNIDTYRRLRSILMQRYFTVKFYSKDDNAILTREMYLDDKEVKKLYVFNSNLLGVFDYNINLISTNRDVEDGEIKIKFANKDILYSKQDSILSYEGDIDDITGEAFKQYTLPSLTKNESPSGYKLAYWYATDKDQTKEIERYYPNNFITLWKNLELYPHFVEFVEKDNNNG